MRATQTELDFIKRKMKLAQISNREAYFRKMACDGNVVRIDFTDLLELVRLLSNATNNLSEIAKLVIHTVTRISLIWTISDVKERFQLLTLL